MDIETLKRRSRKAADVTVTLATDSAERKNFRRMRKTRGHGTLELRTPWLAYSLIDFLASKVVGARVFEFGGGGSTAWFLDQGADLVVTVEHDEGWHGELDKALGGHGNSDIRFRSSADNYEDYVHAIDAYPDSYFDIVVVDGRERVRSAFQAATKVRPGGLLLIDDIDRSKYLVVNDGALSGWTFRRFDGFAPCKPALAHTGVWTAP